MSTSRPQYETHSSHECLQQPGGFSVSYPPAQKIQHGLLSISLHSGFMVPLAEHIRSSRPDLCPLSPLAPRLRPACYYPNTSPRSFLCLLFVPQLHNILFPLPPLAGILLDSVQVLLPVETMFFHRISRKACQETQVCGMRGGKVKRLPLGSQCLVSICPTWKKSSLVFIKAQTKAGVQRLGAMCQHQQSQCCSWL